ncbi:zinc-binding dehydrogenase [Nevskia soli]|uniref:zinc-binding dehydrogenase n=1 Tax=Nevskia soli TaxID=418856 RepID=UPI0004A6C667|nr:zinc-binding dehydrogenase [Nevskia soli]
MDRSLSLVGGDLWSWLNSADERRARTARLLDAVVQGQLQVRIAARIPLAEGRRAHELLESRGVIGKIILIP